MIPPASGWPIPLYPGFDTLGTLEYITKSGHDYTWFVLDTRIIEKEFALSGQQQNRSDRAERTRAAAFPRTLRAAGTGAAFVDREVANKFSKDGQITAIRAARGYLGRRRHRPESGTARR